MIQVGSSTAGDLRPRPTEGGQLRPRPTEGGQNLLGKFVEEQLENMKITNVEEEVKTDPKITKVNKVI